MSPTASRSWPSASAAQPTWPASEQTRRSTESDGTKRERNPRMTRDQIRELGQRWADAERRGDADALDALLSDDFVIVGPLGFVLDRQQYLEPRRSGVLRLEAHSWD